MAEALGVLPDHPASMRDLAAVLAGVEPDLVVDSRAYASAMASATDFGQPSVSDTSASTWQRS